MLTKVEREIIERAEADAQARAAPPPPPKDRVIRENWNVSRRCMNSGNFISTIMYMKATGAKHAEVKDYSDAI